MRRITSKNFFLTLATMLVMLLSGQSAMAQYYKLTALSGTGGTGGEGYASLVDGVIATKMGHSFDPANPDRAEAWIIVKAEEAFIPKDYFLITGGDTGSFPTRNWKSWNIYGANFASDAEAVKGAEGWTLVDQKGNQVLPAENFGLYSNMCSMQSTTPYQYYMVEITESQQGSDVWLQMSEFGFGTYNDYLNYETPETKPITYRIVAGDRNDASGEGLFRLFDGNNGSKWGNGFNETDGNYAIFKTSRAIVPTYYKLTTGTDNAQWTGRNWSTYSIYGIAEADESLVTRDAEGWVLLDERVDVGTDVLPDLNSYEVYFNFNQENDTKYQYFKIEIKNTQGGGYQQMSEFALGDAAQYNHDKAAYLAFAQGAVDLTKPFQKTLMDQLTTLFGTFQSSTDPAVLGKAYNEFMTLKTQVDASTKAYEDYKAAVDKLMTHYKEHNCITGEGKTVVGNYLETNGAPGEQYTNGTYLYIMENLLLDVDALTAEVHFVDNLLETYASDLFDSPIGDDVLLTYLAGTPGFGDAEGPGALFDDTYDTKWCSGGGAPVFVMFSASEPVAPTWYMLTTANDTQGSGRNWKNWKIYGANFASEDEAIANYEDMSLWTLIDNKENVGSDQLPDANYTDAYFSMSAPSQTKFQYFRIDVDAYVNSDIQQMATFKFGNEADRLNNRNTWYEEYAYAFDFTDAMVQKALVEKYQQLLETLSVSTSIVEMGSCKTDLASTMTQIEENMLAYLQFQDTLTWWSADLYSEFPSVVEWANGYFGDEAIAPSAVFKNGSMTYIMQNCELSTAELKQEMEFLTRMADAAVAENEVLICLGGYTGGSWGDHENWAKLIDGNYDTKWGGVIGGNGNYVIFRTLEPSNPYFYTLNTGGDTETYPGRNWGSWKIYGANFEGDGAVDVDAEDWVLIDEKTSIAQDRLHPTNNTASYFGFSTETTEKYTYYKVVVTAAYDGTAIQMQELIFGTEEEFQVIQENYKNAAEEFNYSEMIAEQKLLDNYGNSIDGIADCKNMEVLFRINYGLEQLRDSITNSAASYTYYMNEVEKAKAYLLDNELTESDALTIYDDYVNGGDEASELYPNGQAQYIIETHLLPDSVVEDEVFFMENLQKAAVAVGYQKGTDITSLIVNSKFAQGSEGWSQELLGYQTDRSISFTAAEMVREKEIFDLNQTVTGLKNGFYKVKLNAAFRPGTDDIYSYNHSALAYANDVATFVPVVREYMIPVDKVVDGVNCYVENCKPIEVLDEMGTEVTDTLGYVLWGLQSCCTAFNNGQFELTLVAEVTDGNLTVGVKNDGTPQGGDWCAFGDFQLYYLGEEADAESLAEAAACNAARIDVLGTEYAASIQDPMDTEYQKAPDYGAAQLEALKALKDKAEYAALVEASAIFQDISENKRAYAALVDALNNVSNKWYNELEPGTEEETEFYDVTENVLMNLDAASYANSEATKAAKAELYAKYPDYLVLDVNSISTGLEYEQNAAFTYAVAASTVNSPTLAFSGFYEDIDSTRCILAVDYKAAQKLEGGAFYFATPNLTSSQTIPTGDLEATEGEEWKTMYWDITNVIKAWGFGKIDSWLRWDITNSDATGYAFSVSKVRMITVAQMEAEGGMVNAIDKVQDGIAPAVDGIFTISGVRVQKAQKGLYIINGKKVLVK